MAASVMLLQKKWTTMLIMQETILLVCGPSVPDVILDALQAF